MLSGQTIIPEVSAALLIINEWFGARAGGQCLKLGLGTLALAAEAP